MPSTDPILAEFTSFQVALMALAIAGLTIYMLATRNRIRRSASESTQSARARLDELTQRSRLSRDLEEVMVELDELSRQVNGRLDTRFAKLEAVIRDADERIDKLTRLLREARGESTLDVTVNDGEVQNGAATQADPSPGEPKSAPLHGDVYDLADEGLTPARIAAKTGRTTGEVELILALRRTKARAASSIPPC